jgi:hypothetical protein
MMRWSYKSVRNTCISKDTENKKDMNHKISEEQLATLMNVDQRAGMRWGIFAFLKFKNVCLCAEKPEDAPSL